MAVREGREAWSKTDAAIRCRPLVPGFDLAAQQICIFLRYASASRTCTLSPTKLKFLDAKAQCKPNICCKLIRRSLFSLRL